MVDTNENHVVCRDLQREYRSREGHGETERQFVAQGMSLSMQQTARYDTVDRLIPEIQQMIRTKKIASSCTDQIAYKSHEQQMKIYQLLCRAESEGIRLTRDGVVVPIAKRVGDDVQTSWEQVKPLLKIEAQKVKKTKPTKELEKESRPCDLFVDGIAARLQDLGYTIERSNKKSWDHKGDLITRSPIGKKVVVQSKYRRKPYAVVSVDAVREADEARRNFQADAAIVVTNRSFTSGAVQLAVQLGVELWDGARLKALF